MPVSQTVFDAVVDMTPSLADLEPYATGEWRERVAQLSQQSSTGRRHESGRPAPPADASGALVWSDDGGHLTGVDDPYLAAELARSANDWTLEQCLGADERLRGSILVATHLPELAAREIARCAPAAQMRQVLLCSNGVGRTFGHAVFAPIHEAAASAGLPLAIQAGATGGVNPSPVGGGAIGLELERRTLAVEGLMTHLLGFISNGVFERYPDLKVVLAGGGVGWLTALLWRLDTNFKGVKREIPWVKSLPSEYVARHVRLTTYPLEEAPAEQLARIVELAGGEPLLIYGSGSPHADAAPPADVRAVFPESWGHALLYANAQSTYGL